MNARKIIILGALPLMVLVFAFTANAELAERAPQLSATTGFPLWYRDLPVANANDRALQPCLVPNVCTRPSPAIAGNAASQRAGFGTAWYFHIETKVGPVGNHFGEFVAGVRASYLGSTAARTQKRVINQIRIDLRRLPVPGNYIVIHPFGRTVLTAIPDNNGTFDATFVESVGGTGFDRALTGPVGPYVRAVNPAAPAGFIGSHAVDQTIIGARAPGANFFQIIGPPGADFGGGRRSITQRNFKLMGRLF